MTINTEKQQITCIYASGTKFGKQLKALAEATKKAVFFNDIKESMPSDTQWHDIVNRLKLSLNDLIDKSKIEDLDENTNFKEEDLVKILAKYPDALVGAILLEDNHIEHITQYTSLLKFFNVDSAGLEKTLHFEDPVTESQTKNETFL
ncbi:hypothetical protein DFQ05_0818 [Winogradskyella wandonensis]|uniref:Arsenate reductase-like glutaredoxin family protein n=1 Tax=Winogradskyella wandonensis TaxID=1442586 RepID=A0A4R1KXD8_9FLAO|nr:hypothetical protein [Winogradskyella wandonensis]TCK69297.1 hypothetical protein DFQ05_0818 [Winogradskyella wandonensis]